MPDELRLAIGPFDTADAAAGELEQQALPRRPAVAPVEPPSDGADLED